MTGFIYAVGDGAGRVKIGWSADPLRRLAKIRSDCPTAASLLGLVLATQAQEAEAHKLLAPWRVNREWFRLEGPVAVFVAMLPKPMPRSMMSSDGRLRRRFRREMVHPLADWIDAQFSQTEFAHLVGCSESHLSLILSGERGVSTRLAVRMSDATNGVVPVRAFVRTEEEV